MKSRSLYRFFLIIPGLVFITFIQVNAQEMNAQEETDRKGQLYLAPDIGLMFGTTTSIELSPMLGYYLTNRFTIAAGARFEYYNFSRKYYGNLGYETSIYGPRMQARYVIIRNTDNIIPLRLNLQIFVQAEQEFLSLERKYFEFPRTSEEGRFWQPFTLAGAGISQQVGRNILMNLVFLWDLDNTLSSPYTNPVIRIGFQFGFGKKEEI